MARKTNKAAAIDAADKLSQNLHELMMLGDLLSMADDSITDGTVRTAGNNIWRLADEANKASSILTDCRQDFGKGGES